MFSFFHDSLLKVKIIKHFTFNEKIIYKVSAPETTPAARSCFSWRKMCLAAFRVVQAWVRAI
jgi:hypothetical protein